jgi:cation diffusion facilitator CzcD-associated flavoprotein CzcO
MHTARWDEKFDWKGKAVALIGAGSSGIQILPQIQPSAKKVVHFVKGKMWISPVGYGVEEGGATDKGELVFERPLLPIRPYWAST